MLAPLRMPRADPHDRLRDRPVDEAALRDDRVLDDAVGEPRSRQKPGVRVDRPLRVVEAERRVGPRQQDVRVVEGLIVPTSAQ